MAHLVVGYPGPVALCLVEQLARRGEEVVVIGKAGPRLPTDVEFVSGDCAQVDFGLSGASYRRLLDRVRRLTVAETTEHQHKSDQGFRDVEEARPIRVASEIVEFVSASTVLEGTTYLSSFAVFGDSEGTIFEKDFELGQSFSRQRDEVLAVAEKQIHRLPGHVRLGILRTANLAGWEETGEILPGAELGRLANFAVAAPDECEFAFTDLPIHFETIERTVQALMRIEPVVGSTSLHLVDDDPWTDRQIIKWMFERLEKRFVEVSRASPSVTQFFRAATTQSGRVRPARAHFERVEAARQMPDLLARDVEQTLGRLFKTGLSGGLG